ncbi:hypothetical protein MLD38_000132 [Melastoma candidum]|uniref:Uncharacterized protein n=1 Tax=Melastoma candidum TaxID=119954 RepID=A0ACB9SAE2_9MYRT|nr:hypothetical protein MLD38_000132 [Melastoma candidum]
MDTRDQGGRSLPKFGEWDVNNPASADGFTVIFSKARDEKKSNAAGMSGQISQRGDNTQRRPRDPPTPPQKKGWCCF